MRQSGLAGLMPSLSETVWVGVSAGRHSRPSRAEHRMIALAPAAQLRDTIELADR
jgi:hypothetical protein